MKIISLGWGVQSWVLAAMSALDELPKVDFAIHSDTTWERSATYEFAKQWTPWLQAHGVKVVTVNDAEQTAKVASEKSDIPAFTRRNGDSIFIPAESRYEVDTVIDRFGGVSIPAHTPSDAGFGQLRRQCTQRWKIQPMRRFIAAEMKRRVMTKTEGAIEQWLGITVDEIQRAKDSDVKYIKHKFPLLDLGMTRADCLHWLEKSGLPNPGKSSCVFCPYHNNSKWEALKRDNGTDWQIALQVDAAIRDKRPPYPLYLHRRRQPLDEAVTIPEDYGASQLGLFEEIDNKDAECDSGFCFL